jgi:two-component system, OmpR family, response regulator
MKILIVDDDKSACALLSHSLSQLGHECVQAHDGKTGLAYALSINADVIILDRMLPLIDGLEIVRTLRAEKRDTPVLILSALDEVDQRVQGLRAGSDDYLSKPFDFAELTARIDALFRRKTQFASTDVLRYADIELDIRTRRVTRSDKKLDLTGREFQLLEFLMRHAGQVVTRSMILKDVWDYHFDPKTNVIDVHISRLRQALDKNFDVPLLHTIRGSGYTLAEKI